MPILQQGSLNTSGIIVPDLYVQTVAPQNILINAVPTNLVGVVGSASWGPVNQPVIIATASDYAAAFGAVIARKYDMGTQIATAAQQGAANFRCVRVTDGTDTAAQMELGASGGNFAVKIMAIHTGSYGNAIAVTLASGSSANTLRLTVAVPGALTEVFDNLPTATPAGFWQALVAAVNTGSGQLRGPSQFISATIGSAMSFAPSPLAAQVLTGGSDGAAGVDAQILVGQDIIPRQGMYALRGQGCSICLLADADDSSQWTSQASFALSEGIYMILTGPQGDTISDAVTTLQQVGVNSYAAKLMFGDWIYWSDLANNTIRLVSPQGFVAGRLSTLSPEQSSLNKQIYGVIGSQKSGAPGSNQVGAYSDADLQTLFSAGIDVIANPQPGGAYWGVRCGHNTSSNPATWNDSYTRMSNFIAATLASAMGGYVGEVINGVLFRQIRASVLSYLQALLQQGILGSVSGGLPFAVVCDASNNPSSRTALGYVQCDVQVQYQGINEKFIVNVDGGQTVQVQSAALTVAA